MTGNGFLYCTPSVFVIGNEYEILINLNNFGICFVDVGGTFYYEENTGVLPSERKIVKIRVPQSVLDAAKAYKIVFRQTEQRKSYNSTFLPPLTESFEFKPLENEENIKIYYLSDVHYRYDIAKETASYFGDDVDLFVMNGDIGEVDKEQSYLNICNFVGEVAKGKTPVVFSRGNHDTRGRLAAMFTDYFPSQEKNTYYTFEIGRLRGIVLDCGEDKLDSHREYDSSENTPAEYLGANRFHEYRIKQLEFLKNIEPDNEKLTIVISHICPAMTTSKKDGPFDIERELYTEWCEELDRIDPAFMLCGHYHNIFVLEPGNERSLIPHKYPIISGAKSIFSQTVRNFWGTAIVIGKDKAEMYFTDDAHCVQHEYSVKLL